MDTENEQLSEAETDDGFDESTAEFKGSDAEQSDDQADVEAGTLAENEADADDAEAEQTEGAGSETADEEESEQTRKRIAEEAFKRREAERKAQEYEARLKELEARNSGLGERPEIPPKPEGWESDYEQRLDAYIQAEKEAALYDARLEAQGQQEAQQQEAKERERQEASQKALQGFVSRANEAKVDLGQLDAAGRAIANWGVSPGVQDFIVEQDLGPQIVMHLASNIDALDELAKLPPERAGVYIESVIKPKLSANARKSTKAPPPTEVISGRGTPQKEDAIFADAEWK